jgi:hypothetical protein
MRPGLQEACHFLLSYWWLKRLSYAFAGQGHDIAGKGMILQANPCGRGRFFAASSNVEQQLAAF